METENLEEILACMEDSDRYINQSAKNRLVIRIRNELVRRGFKQYNKKQNKDSVE